MLRLGVDVGGANTDAVAMDGLRVLGKVKVTVTPDVTTGITQRPDAARSAPAIATRSRRWRSRSKKPPTVTRTCSSKGA